MCLCGSLLLYLTAQSPASSWGQDMTQPEEWLEELLGFSEDGSRRWFPPCETRSIPEGLVRTNQIAPGAQLDV